MMSSLFTPHTQVSSSSVPSNSSSSVTYGTTPLKGGARNLSAISILSFIPSSGAPSSAQNQAQLLNFLQYNLLKGQISQSSFAKGGTEMTLTLHTPIGELKVQSSHLLLPKGQSQVEIFSQQQRVFLRPLSQPISQPIAQNTNTATNVQTSLNQPTLQNPQTAITANPSLQGAISGKVIQSAGVLSPAIGQNLQAASSNSHGGVQAVSAHALGVLRSLVASPSSQHVLSSVSQNASLPVHVQLQSSPSAGSSALLQGIVSSVSSNVGSQNSSATIAFFGGTLDVRFATNSPPVQSGSKVSFTLAPAQTSANARFTPNITQVPAATNTSTPAQKPLPSQNAGFTSITTGNAVQLQVHAISLQGQLHSISNPPSDSTLQQGVFSNQTITNANGVIKLDAPLRLPQGTQLHYTLQTVNTPQNTPVVPLADTLLETMEVLLSSNATSLNTQNLQTLLPQTQSAVMTPALLFLLSALGKGKPEQWLGKPLQNILQRQHPDLAKRLQQQFSSRSRPASTSSPWQWSSLPIASQQHLDHIFFGHYHEQTSTEEKDGKQAPQPPEKRFRIASRFRNFGPIQIEGRIQTEKDPLQPLKKRDFSLMIASEGNLSATIEADIRSIVQSLGDALHLSSYLHFRNTIDPTWVTTPPN